MIVTMTPKSQNLLLGTSANGRYLVNGSGTPIMLIGDSPQGMMSDLTPAQMVTYMANREGYGVNCLQVHLLSGATFGGNSTTFQAQDGTHPFTSDGDISTPNASYFAQVDAMLNLAASHGMVVILTAAETIDAGAMFKANGTTKCTNFGTYLGNRYKNYPNIIWSYGNDYTPGNDVTLDNCLFAMLDGIAAQDSNHLHTMWPFINQGARANSGWNSRVTFDFAYCYAVPYGVIRTEYALSPAKPIHMGEAYYEAEHSSTPLRMRRTAYYTMLAGACGHIYCCGPDTYTFASGWATRLDSYPGLTHVSTRLISLLSAYAWYNLLLDTGHTILTAGYGTYDVAGDIDSNDYAPCAYLANNSLALIYMPTNRTMTVDMSQFSGTVTARWYDPTDGNYTADAASPLSNSGTHQFSRIATNSSGDSDWILVLEV